MKHFILPLLLLNHKLIAREHSIHRSFKSTLFLASNYLALGLLKIIVLRLHSTCSQNIRNRRTKFESTYNILHLQSRRVPLTGNPLYTSETCRRSDAKDYRVLLRESFLAVYVLLFNAHRLTFSSGGFVNPRRTRLLKHGYSGNKAP